MSERDWRRVAILLMAVVAILWWRDCRSPRRAQVPPPECPPAPHAAAASAAVHDLPGSAEPMAGEQPWNPEEDPPPAPDWRRQVAQHWAVRFLTPRPGETLFDYRDRVVPAAQLAIAPQRARVARNRRRLVEAAALDGEQERALESAVDRAAGDIQDRVMQSVLSGELMPANVKPSTAVALARDVLDMLDRANRDFRGALDRDQLAILDDSGFDVVDYLVFSTRWEDMLGMVQ